MTGLARGRFWLSEILRSPPAYLEGLKFVLGTGEPPRLGEIRGGNRGRQLTSLFWATEIGDRLGTGSFPAVSRVFVSHALCPGTGAARSRSGSSGSGSSGSLWGFRSVDSSVWGSVLRSL